MNWLTVLNFFYPDYGVDLEDIERWDRSRRVADIANRLDFIEDASQWWVYLQGSVRQISEDDFSAILSGDSQDGDGRQDIESESLFALEKHLEEFIDENWSEIDWGADLRLYRDGEQRGRQYPAGTWSIDFLAVDNRTDDFVVIELKRGQTGDSTVGQVLRYMSWVRQNLVSDKRAVRGIIVAKDVDDSLRYAARELDDVELMTYTVDFTLHPTRAEKSNHR